MRRAIPYALLCTALTAPLPARPGSYSARHLYSEPDPSAAGGIQGSAPRAGHELVMALAVPADEPRLVYRAGVTGARFDFKGLPMRNYDLVLVFEDSVWEGIRLVRGENTLTRSDRQDIETIILKSEPFFDVKSIHRMEGSTGDGGEARCLCTLTRTRTMKGLAAGNSRQAVKLIVLKDVGPAWQVARAREFFSRTVPTASPPLRVTHEQCLEAVRVTDHVKDLGEIRLGSR